MSALVLIAKLGKKPDLCLSHLLVDEGLDIDSKTLALVNKRLNAKELIEVAESFGRGSKFSAIDICDSFERSINSYYKDILEESRGDRPSFHMLKERRQVLARIRSLAGQKKIPLNATLASEALLKGSVGKRLG